MSFELPTIHVVEHYIERPKSVITRYHYAAKEPYSVSLEEVTDNLNGLYYCETVGEQRLLLQNTIARVAFAGEQTITTKNPHAHTFSIVFPRNVQASFIEQSGKPLLRKLSIGQPPVASVIYAIDLGARPFAVTQATRQGSIEYIESEDDAITGYTGLSLLNSRVRESVLSRSFVSATKIK